MHRSGSLPRVAEASSIDLPVARAQLYAMALAEQHAEPDVLGPLYDFLCSPAGADLPRT